MEEKIKMTDETRIKLLDFIYYNYLLMDFLDEEVMEDMRGDIEKFLNKNKIKYSEIELNLGMNIDFIIGRDVLCFAITSFDEDDKEEREEFVIGVKSL